MKGICSCGHGAEDHDELVDACLLAPCDCLRYEEGRVTDPEVAFWSDPDVTPEEMRARDVESPS